MPEQIFNWFFFVGDFLIKQMSCESCDEKKEKTVDEQIKCVLIVLRKVVKVSRFHKSRLRENTFF